MATGTGKTFTMVNEIYRLMKSGTARWVLFLVDRRFIPSPHESPASRLRRSVPSIAWAFARSVS